MGYIRFKGWSIRCTSSVAIVFMGCAGTDKDLGDTQDAVGTSRGVDVGEEEPYEGNVPVDEATEVAIARGDYEESTSGNSGLYGDEEPLVAETDATLDDDMTATARSSSCEPLPSETFEEATTVSFSRKDLFGVWTGDFEEDVLGLPSGSHRVTLTIAEDHITLILGEYGEDPRPLLDGRLGASGDAREGFEYTVIPGEAVGGVFPTSSNSAYNEGLELAVAPFEVYGALCAEKAPSEGTEPGCAHSCLPAEVVDWGFIDETRESDECLVDDEVYISCDEASLCIDACRCDENSCYYNAFTTLEFVAGVGEVGRIDLYLPTIWTPATGVMLSRRE